MKPSAANLAVLAMLAGGCTSALPENPRTSGDDEVAARIVNPTDESRAELQHAVSDMLFGADVLLADDALTHSSTLTIERSRVRNLDSPPLSGRDLGQPERFRLVISGGRCVLVHGDDRGCRELAETECVAAE